MRKNGRSTRLDATRFVVLDTELTGLDSRRDDILSIGAVRMTGGRIEIGDSFYRLVRPETALKPASVLIHEITTEDVLHKPVIDEVLNEFADYFGTAVLVGFCIDIDLEFLNREMRRLRGGPIENTIIDVHPLYEWARSRSFHEERATSMPGRAQLYDIARYYGISVTGAHNALMDAFMTAQVFQRLIPVLMKAGIMDVGELIRLSNRLKGGDRHSVSHGIISF